MHRQTFCSLLLLISLQYYLVSAVARTELILDGYPTWQTNQWYEQVDGVMGGQSSGSLSFMNSNSILSFTGTISLDGGGFSSVRKRQFDKVLDLSKFAGIVVTLMSTSGFQSNNNNNINNNNNNILEPPLGLHLQFHDTPSSYGYASAFAVPLTQTSNEEISVFLPLSSFNRATRFGFQCNNNCQIDWRYVNGMDVYVLFQEGDFHVKIKRIAAVENVTTSFVSPTISIDSMNGMQDLIASTIKSGGALYDYDYKELCIAMYRSTLNTLLEANIGSSSSGEEDEIVSDLIRGMICQGLQRADAQGNNKVDVAWTLRYTMDAILEELGAKEQQAAQGGNNAWRPDVATAQTYRCNGVTSGSGTYAIVPRSEPPSQTPTMATTRLSSLIPSSSSADIPSETTTTTDRPTTNPKIIINTLIPTVQTNNNTTSPTISNSMTTTTTFSPTPNPMPMIIMSTQSPTMIHTGGDKNNNSSGTSSILVGDDNVNDNENKDTAPSMSASSSNTRIMPALYSMSLLLLNCMFR